MTHCPSPPKHGSLASTGPIFEQLTIYQPRTTNQWDYLCTMAFCVKHSTGRACAKGCLPYTQIPGNFIRIVGRCHANISRSLLRKSMYFVVSENLPSLAGQPVESPCCGFKKNPHVGCQNPYPFSAGNIPHHIVIHVWTKPRKNSTAFVATAKPPSWAQLSWDISGRGAKAMSIWGDQWVINEWG